MKEKKKQSKKKLIECDWLILPKNAPKYDKKLSYYEQAPGVLSFYEIEKVKRKEGFMLDGIFIHPFLYNHLNYFKTPIPVLKEGSDTETQEVIMKPPLDDHIWYFIENLKRCPIEQKGMFIFGCRGFSKSSIIASYTNWKSSTEENGTGEIIGGNDVDLTAISKLMEIGFNRTNPAFRLPVNKADWKKHVQFGIKMKNNEPIVFSDIFIKNASAGTGGKSEQGAGGSPMAFVLDEAGKWEFIKLYQSALPAFKTPYGMKLYPLISGTGGNNTLSKDAKKVLKKPSEYSLLSMDWEILNRMVPKEYRTWDDNDEFGIFVPGQMSYRLPVKKIKTTLDVFLGVKSKILSKIEINVTDWKECKKYIEEHRASLSDEDALNKFKMYHPLTAKECFLENTVNPFPVGVINKRIDELEAEGNIGRKVEILRSKSEWATLEFSDKPLASFPFEDFNIDAPIQILNNHKFPEAKPPDDFFVAGHDGYKVEKSENSDSVGTFMVIRRRNTGLNTPTEYPVACYAARPVRKLDLYKNGEVLLETYNAVCNPEAIDVGFIEYLDNKDKAHELLCPGMSFGSTNSKKKGKINTKFGTPASGPNKSYIFELVVDHARTPHIVDSDEDGNTIYKLGVEFIDDIELLREMSQYKEGGNFDRIIAWGHALVYARELDKQGRIPNYSSVNPAKEKPTKVRNIKAHSNRQGISSFSRRRRLR